jgi:outer membrane lipoprotein carrier protein
MKILFTCLFLAIPFYFCASQRTANAQDPAAEPYLKNLSKLFDPDKKIQIEFRYEVDSQPDSSKTSDFGSVIIKGSKYKLKLEDGEMYYNGEKLWVYNINAAEVYSSIPKDENKEQMLIDPFRLLSRYRENYKYKLKNEATLNGKKYIYLELYPKKLETNYSILRIFLDKTNNNLYSLELQQKNGIIYKIFVNEILNPVKIDDSVFSWDAAAHPDVLEVEM